MTHPPKARQAARNWEETYQELGDHQLPWFWQELDADFAEALAAKSTKGRLLDIGTGQGNQATALAALGYEVLGLDLAKRAIERAQALALDSGSAAKFRVFDVQTDALEEPPFDWILDRGCWHVFGPEGRAAYAQRIKSWLAPQGRLLLKCFSYQQPGTEGPNRIHPDDLQAAFKPAGLTVASLTETHFFGNHDPFPQALFAVVRLG